MLNQFNLLTSRRFLPLFITQFFGAFNDNIFKNALIILITYKIASDSATAEQITTTLAAGIFILPFFLLSATAGQLADKLEKTFLIRLVKICEIGFMVLASLGFHYKSVILLMLTLFLMGVHSTFFGPLKYAILPDHLKENELIAGNALIEAGTFISILIGTILGGILILTDAGETAVSVMIILVAIGGFISSLFIPKTIPAQPSLKVNLNFIAETFRIIKQTRSYHNVFLSILGISWFWLVGATFLAQFPNLAKNVLSASPHVVTLFLTVFSIGIAIGSLLSNKLQKGVITAKYVPLGILGMTVFTVDMYFACSNITPHNASIIISAWQFLSTLNGWRLTIDLLLIAICGGIYAVPLYAIVQTETPAEHRARAIACNNILNACFMVIAAVICVVLLTLHISIPQIFLIMAILNAGVALYICKLLPFGLLQMVLQSLLSFFYKVKVEGLENYHAAGKRVVLIANHTSFIDVLLLTAYLPDKLMFAVNTYIAKQWWMRPALTLIDAFIMDPTNPMAAKPLIRAIREDRRCLIFPEGRITVTGALMKVYEGPGMIADKSEAVLLPVRIDGAQYTPFSRLRGKIRMHWFPQITLKIMPSKRFEVDSEIKGRKRRQIISAKLYDIMTEMMFESSDYRKTVFQSLLDARKINGGDHLILEDIERKPINYNQLIARSFILGEYISKHSMLGEAVGILLPNANATVICFFGTLAFGRVPAMLNFSTGANNLVTACRTAVINTIYTSHKFIETARLQNVIEKLTEARIKIIYLEDLRQQISLPDKLIGLWRGKFAGYFYKKLNRLAATDQPAVILFTSGSEGTPKGVVLSHENLQSNRYQLSARVPFSSRDLVLNALPIFHSFGLTAATLLPILSGMRTFLYPSPLHYRIVPELIYDTNATITFGTDTFLSGYARYAHPYDFYSVRYVFAGAEKVKDETRRIWSEKYGMRILEGYGATETSPVIAGNTPMQNKIGTVGRVMPGMQYRLEPVPGIEEGGRLFVKGPNIMLGYLLADAPGMLKPPVDGWYDTGDIVAIDEQGYVSIKDRAKRFAKVGGEMISLTFVENYLGTLWPTFHHAVVSIPDEKRGEQLVLVTENKTATRDEIVNFVRSNGYAELSIPRKIIYQDKLPILGTGKIDYVSVKNFVLTQFSQ